MDSTTSTYDKVKIHEALELLDAAASEGYTDLKDIVGDNYQSFRQFAGSLNNKVQRHLSDAYISGKEKVIAAAGAVDKNAHTNPWIYIGGSAAVGILIGVLIARGRR